LVKHNSAQTTNAGIFGAKTTAADVIVSSNRVSSTAKAFIDRTGTTVPTADPTVTVTGALTILAHDDSGIFSNAKLVASAITTNDGGTHLLGNALDGTPSHDFTSSQGTQTLTFGTKVLIDKGFDTPSFTAGGRAPAITSVAPDYVVSLGDTYGVSTLTSNDGFRILSRGDVVQVADDWTGGGNPAGIYEYVGLSQRTDLGNTDYSDTTLWALRRHARRDLHLRGHGRLARPQRRRLQRHLAVAPDERRGRNRVSVDGPHHVGEPELRQLHRPGLLEADPADSAAAGRLQRDGV
jgi:hypothetical protein